MDAGLVESKPMPVKPAWIDLVNINLFWLAINFRNQAVFTYFTTYLVVDFVTAESRNTALGILNAAGLAVALIAQPLMGLISDRSTSRLGRRRPFIILGVFLEIIGLVCLTLVGGYIGLLLVVLYLQFSANISHGPYQGLIPDLVSEKEREKASSVKAVFELLPTLLVGLTIARLLEEGYFNKAVFLTGLILIVLMVLTVFLVRETPSKTKPDIQLAQAMIRVAGLPAGLAIGAVSGFVIGGLVGGLAAVVAWPFTGQQFPIPLFIGVGGIVAMVSAIVVGVLSGARLTLGREISSNSPYVWWIVNRFLFLAAITSIPRFAPYFLMAAFQLDRQAAVGKTGDLIIVVGILILVSAIASPWLAKVLDPIKMLSLSGLTAAFGTLVLLATISDPNDLLLFSAGGILGIAGGLFFTTNWALGTMLVPPDQAGRYLGVSNLAGAGAGIVGMGLAGYLADYFNLIQPGLGYFIIFGSYGIMFLLSVVSLRGIKRISTS